jgi:hypothetical protein
MSEYLNPSGEEVEIRQDSHQRPSTQTRGRVLQGDLLESLQRLIKKTGG